MMTLSSLAGWFLLGERENDHNHHPVIIPKIDNSS